MCNAYNHPAGCTCGWGGEGHLGGGFNSWSVPGSDTLSTTSSHDWEERDFTHPTSCPECGAEVYFIRHNGGSVWVDELGWPWPRHGCFDKPNEPTRSFGTWSAKASGLGKPNLGIITQVRISFGSNDPILVVQMNKAKRFSLVPRMAFANLIKLMGALVIVSFEDNVLLHPDLGEIPFHSLVEVGGENDEKHRTGWYECERCKAWVKAGTGHEEHCRRHWKAVRPVEAKSIPNSAKTNLPSWRKALKQNLQKAIFPVTPKAAKQTPPSPSFGGRIKLPNKLEDRIVEAMDMVAREAWLVVPTESPPENGFVLAKQEAKRIIKMLSPHVRGQVEHRFSSAKWERLRSRHLNR
jgi:hypothetical protein